MFTCTYCLQQHPDSLRSEEHVVGAALGGVWTVDEICGECQSSINEAVDRPFAQTLWIREQRHRHEIPDRYGKQLDAPVVQGRLDDGRHARLMLARTGWELRLSPTTRAPLSFTVSTEDEREFLQKKIERLARDHPGHRFEVSNRSVLPTTPEGFTSDFSVPMRLWPRFAAKVALTVGREIRNEPWLHSEHALLLHEILWGRAPHMYINPLPTKDVPWKRSGITTPPDHFLLAMNGLNGDGMLLLVLFGEDTYGMPLGEPLAPREQQAWVLHTHERGYEQMPLDDFWTRIIRPAVAPPIEH